GIVGQADVRREARAGEGRLPTAGDRAPRPGGRRTAIHAAHRPAVGADGDAGRTRAGVGPPAGRGDGRVTRAAGGEAAVATIDRAAGARRGNRAAAGGIETAVIG